MCKIEKGKGIDNEPKSKGGRPRKYPFKEMKVGDSFFVPHKTVRDISGSLNHANKTLHPANFKAGLYHNGKRVIKDGAPGVRVVRIV